MQNEFPDKPYVYTLAYPDGKVFYVGKGTGNRIDDHERQARIGIRSHKCSVIRKIWKEGGQVLRQKVAFFDTEDEAYQFEIHLIAFFGGKEELTNKADGGEGGSRPGAGRPRRHLHLDKDTSLLLNRVRRARTDTTTTGAQIINEVAQLAFMIPKWQSLIDLAEVIVPDLLHNDQWIALKQPLEQRTDEIGVTAFIRSIGEQYRQQLEESDEE